MVRDPHMRQLAHGIWARWDVGPPPDLKNWERAALVLPVYGSGAAVSGLSAVSMLQLPLMTGMSWMDDLLSEAPVLSTWPVHPEISLPQNRKAKPLGDLHLRSRRLELATQPGPWNSAVTGTLETLLVLHTWFRGWRAVPAVDHALAFNLGPEGLPHPLQPEDLAQVVEDLPPGTRNKQLLLQSLERAAPNVWSPMESVLRLVFVQEGLPLPAHNLPVVLGSGQLAYLDLVWEKQRTAVEYNGAVHYRDRQAYGDEMGRLNALRDQGWEVRIVVLEDLVDPVRRRALIAWLRARL